MLLLKDFMNKEQVTHHQFWPKETTSLAHMGKFLDT